LLKIALCGPSVRRATASNVLRLICPSGFDALPLPTSLEPRHRRRYISPREVGAGERLANPVRSGRKQP
jgi:hypothetical protein